jgi:uncharacterized protein
VKMVLRLLLVFFFFLALSYFFRNLFHSLVKGLGSERDKTKKGKVKNEIYGGDMVKDPVCGLYLPRDMAIRKVIRGKEFYFCSEECRRRFLSER